MSGSFGTPDGPSSVLNRKGRVHGPGTRFVVILIAMLVFLGPIALGLALEHFVFPADKGPYGNVVMIAGLIIGFVGLFCLASRGAFMLANWLRPRLEKRVRSLYGIELGDSSLVGISPGREIRSFNGDSSWDSGFLLLEPGRMTYLGDMTAFELRPDQVTNIEPIGKISRLSHQFPRYTITWQAEPGAPEEAFIIEVGDAKTFEECLALNESMLKQLQSWALRQASSDTTWKRFGPPQFPKMAIKEGQKVTGTQATVAAAIVTLAVVPIGIFGMLLVVGREGLSRTPSYSYTVLAIVLFNALRILFQNMFDNTKRK